jgi:hypothetical protein
MADIIRFPQERRTATVEDYRGKPAVILVLPVIRIELDPNPLRWSEEKARAHLTTFAGFRHDTKGRSEFHALVAQFMGDV